MPRLAAAIVASLVIAVPSVGAAPLYRLTDLGMLASNGFTNATSLNATGETTGTLAAPNGDNSAFRYSASGLTSLGTLGGTHSFGQDINSTGNIVGYSYTSTVNVLRGFIANGSTLTPIPTLGGSANSAFGLNDQNWVVGQSFLPGDSRFHAYIYKGGSPIDLGTLGGLHSTAYKVNNVGMVVGSSYIAGNASQHAMLHDGTTMFDLGTLGGTDSRATNINAAGWIVGTSGTAGNAATHAFLFRNGIMFDLGTLGGNFSDAFDINAAGWIVGLSTNASNTYRATLYDGTALHDLNDLIATDDPLFGLITLLQANGINDSGQIVAVGTNHRSYILTPVAEVEAIGTPEPASFVLLGTGLLGLALRRRAA